MGRQRAAYAQLLGCAPEDIALTTSTSEGMSLAVGGLELGPGDEILTSDEEHPGLIGPLQVARDLRGVRVRAVALADIAAAVAPATRLVACSHVGWVSGRLAPTELSKLDVPVLLDGAQAVGAVPVDVRSLGCAIYAGAGQKWLCGPDGTGMLYVSPGMRDRVATTTRSYLSFADPGSGLGARLHPDARRYDTPAMPAEASAFALAALDVLEEAGWGDAQDRARSAAAELVQRLAAAGRRVAARDDSTLVSFHSDDPPTERERLAAAGVIVRDIPGKGLLRASVGAWNDDSDLERLVGALRLGSPMPEGP